MSNLNNALWVGGIVVIAALTAAELISTRSNIDTAGYTKNNIVAYSTTPILPQSDTEPAAISKTDAPNIAKVEKINKPVFEKMIESEYTFDIEDEFAHNLVIDLDNPGPNVSAITEDLLSTAKKKTHSTDALTEIPAANLPADTSADSLEAVETNALEQTDQNETTATEQTALLKEDNPTNLQASIDTAEHDTLTPPIEHTDIEKTPVNATITQHLSAAEQALDDLRMTTPSGDNAFEHYQAILAIEPDNTEALAGIQKMTGMYLFFAEKAINNGNENRAQIYLQRAEHLSPDSPQLKNLRTRLSL